MASMQRVVSPLTGEVSYRAQVRKKGRRAESATFPNRKEAKEWAASIETAIRENRHFPHAAAKRTSFDALAEDYIATLLAEFDPKERATRARQLKWWSEQFAAPEPRRHHVGSHFAGPEMPFRTRRNAKPTFHVPGARGRVGLLAVTGTVESTSSSLKLSLQTFPLPVRKKPKAISAPSVGTSRTMSYRVQSVVPMIGRERMLSKATTTRSGPSTRSHI